MNYFEEVREAAKGCVAILRGDRDAPEYFNLTLHGLVGAVIALLVTMALPVEIQTAVPETQARLSPLGALLVTATVAVAWVIVPYYFLRVVGRPDRFVPFLVVGVWGESFLNVAVFILALVGLGNLLVIFAATFVALYYFVRAAMLVVGLSVGMAIGLIVLELVAAWFTLILVSGVLNAFVLPAAP